MTRRQPVRRLALKHAALSIQTGPFGSQLHADDYRTGGRPVVNPAHLQDGRIEPDPDSAIDEETFRRLAQHELRPGDVVIGRRGELGRCGVVTPEQAGWVCGTGSIRVRPDPAKLEPRWLRWLLSWPGTRDWLSLESVGTTMENLGAETLAMMPILLPAVTSQRAIANYLDRETARIDTLITAKERLVGLLAEKRRALLTDAVTRGLDPGAPLRNSGLPLLGEIPAHWELTRLKFVAHVQTGLALGKNFGSRELREYPYLRVANVQDGFLDLTEVKTVAVPESDALLCRLQVGDVLMNEGGDADKLGRGAIWTGEIDPCLHQNHVFAVRPHSISAEWLASWTSADVAKGYFHSRAKQSTNLASISATNLMELPLLRPSADEQAAIVAHVERETAKLDAVQAATAHTIAVLNERRAGLIAAAVTGQIDVEAAA